MNALLHYIAHIMFMFLLPLTTMSMCPLPPPHSFLLPHPCASIPIVLFIARHLLVHAHMFHELHITKPRILTTTDQSIKDTTISHPSPLHLGHHHFILPNTFVTMFGRQYEAPPLSPLLSMDGMKEATWVGMCHVHVM